MEQVELDIREKFLPIANTYVYKVDDRIVGFIAMIEMEIGGLFVDPIFQSKGIGTQLVDFAAKNRSHLEVEVFAKNEVGLAFYQKYGFVKVDEYHHEDSGQTILRMSTRLTGG